MLVKLSRFFSLKIPKEHLKIIHFPPKIVENSKIIKKEYKVEVRFKIDSSNWITEDVKKKLKEMYPFFIDKGDFFVQSSSKNYSEHPDSLSNETDAIEKMQIMIKKACDERNVRAIELKLEEMKKHIPKETEKLKRSEIKALRRDKLVIPIS